MWLSPEGAVCPVAVRTGRVVLLMCSRPRRPEIPPRTAVPSGSVATAAKLGTKKADLQRKSTGQGPALLSTGWS